jgi:hypothetical protein
MTKAERIARNKERKAAYRKNIDLMRTWILTEAADAPEPVKKAALASKPQAVRSSWLPVLFPNVGVSKTMVEIFTATKMAVGYDMMRKLAKKWNAMGSIIEETKDAEEQPIFTYTKQDDKLRAAWAAEKKAKRAEKAEKKANAQ